MTSAALVFGSSLIGLLAVGYLLAHFCPINQLRLWLRSTRSDVDLVEALRHALRAPPAAGLLDLLGTVYDQAATVRELHTVRAELRSLGLDLVPGRLAHVESLVKQLAGKVDEALAPVELLPEVPPLPDPPDPARPRRMTAPRLAVEKPSAP